ncbi:MAG: serine hydrolase [Parvularcula sp.]|jgi:CubicO group peptidase (beta-lactamase class C family)|nr:serine hydrolase [Parvularcula sp.]
MRRFFFGLFCVLCAAAVIGAFLFFRPFSEHSPQEVIRMVDAPDRRLPYRMMEKIYPAKDLGRAERVTTFPRDLRDLDISYEWDGATRNLEDYVERRNVQGILVLKDGQVVLEEYFGDAEKGSGFTSWSVAKSVVASLIGIALEEGEIESLDDKVSAYDASYVGTDYGDTTIRHLLMMSSGIDFDENYEAEGSDILKLFFNTFLLNKDVDNVLRPYERNREPGQDFDYISSNTQVLGAVLRGAYGTDLASLFREKIGEPIGISGGTWLTDRQGSAGKVLAYCCMQLTLENYAKLGQLYVQDGVVGETRVLPEGWRDFVRTPPTTSHEPKREGSLGYGHHFWLTGGDEGAFAMHGYDGQYVHMDPEEGVVIVMTSADRSAFNRSPEFAKLFRAIKDELKPGGTAGRASQ